MDTDRLIRFAGSLAIVSLAAGCSTWDSMTATRQGTGASTTVAASQTAETRPALVRSVQESLRERGYYVGDVDGQWGPKTEDAVRNFQNANGIPSDGRLSTPTIAALGLEQTAGSAAPK
jgi:peptidoglycan hydrolase-like protein with peptidoglycan-binding domain